MEIEKILSRIEKNKDLLNRYYSTNFFDTDQDGDTIYIFISTKDNKENKRKLNEIKDKFNATSVNFIESDDDEPNFYSLEFQPEKILVYG